VVALFELDPVFGGAQPITGKGILANINVRYKLPNDTLQRTTSYRCPYTVTPFTTLPASYRFATSVAMFAALLKDSRYAHTYGWSEVIRQATDAADPHDAIQQEFITNIEKAKKIYGKERKRKKFIN
jgi:Ca-activated chloride channel family protein